MVFAVSAGEAEEAPALEDPTRTQVRGFLLAGALCAVMGCNGEGAPDQAAPLPQGAMSSEEAHRAEVEAALDAFVAGVTADRPADAAAWAERLQTYLEGNPEFYGSAAALLDEEGRVTASPYVHRTDDGYRTLDLAQPDYDIEQQDWITLPLAADAAVWTPPYFDEGGGEIWMITHSVPASDGDRVFAVVTTDLPVEGPGAAE